MSADKRSVHTDALETLGNIIDETAARDAIHIAVEPVIAGSYLNPGAPIKKGNDGKYRGCKVSDSIGIVDPFIDGMVKPGERFWLLIKPRKITSLRHVWTHPDFDDVEDLPKPAASSSHQHTLKDKSEEWIRRYADELNIGFDDLVDSGVRWVDGCKNSRWGGDYLVRGGLLEGEYTSDEFWEHLAIYKDMEIPDNARQNFFSCSC